MNEILDIWPTLAVIDRKLCRHWSLNSIATIIISLREWIKYLKFQSSFKVNIHLQELVLSNLLFLYILHNHNLQLVYSHFFYLHLRWKIGKLKIKATFFVSKPTKKYHINIKKIYFLYLPVINAKSNLQWIQSEYKDYWEYKIVFLSRKCINWFTRDSSNSTIDHNCSRFDPISLND